MLRIIYIFLLICFATNSYAIKTIIVNKGHTDPIPMAINAFTADNKSEAALASQIVDVVTNDLKSSGVFRPISTAAFIETTTGINHKPLFAAWRQISAKLLVNGQVTRLDSNKIKISFILWDTALEKDLVYEVFEAPQSAWRRVAHKLADKIYEKVTGDDGYFDTRVVYVSETGPYLKRTKRIAIMDQDGANHKYLTDGKNLTLTPRFSPRADKILYLSYIKKTPHVYMKNLKTGKDSLLGKFPGMSFAPHFSPDGTKALISMARYGVTHIYEIDLRTMNTKRLTVGDHINTSATYSPDGSKIVFNSDRNGSRQLYIMDADGSNQQRISFGGGSYATPSWSPKGDYIAFTKITRGEGFTIGIMRPTMGDYGNDERVITSGYLVEGPCWAPNGRVIMFTKSQPPIGKRSGRTRIYSIDIAGYNEQEIPTPNDASYPDWSNSLE